MTKIPFMQKYAPFIETKENKGQKLYHNFQYSPLYRLMEEKQEDVPAHLDLIGNLLCMDFGKQELIFDRLEPTDHIGKSKLTAVVNDKDLFGRIDLHFPLVYRETKPRTTHKYHILRHHMQIREFQFNKRNDGHNNVAKFPDEYKYAYGYDRRDDWWRLQMIDQDHRVWRHMLTDVHPLAMESVFPGEYQFLDEELPYDPGPFVCCSCRSMFDTTGYDIVLVHKLPNKTRSYQQQNYNYNNNHNFRRPHDPEPSILFLTSFCDACLMTLRMLGLLVPETK